MRPEDEARQYIDESLAACGWIVQDYAELNISAGPGVAVREFPLQSGIADYLLYANQQAIRRPESEFVPCTRDGGQLDTRSLHAEKRPQPDEEASRSARDLPEARQAPVPR